MPFTLVNEPERPLTLKDAREAAERQAVIAALVQSSGKKAQAHKVLAVSRATLYRLLRHHGICSPVSPTDVSDDDT